MKKPQTSKALIDREDIWSWMELHGLFSFNFCKVETFLKLLFDGMVEIQSNNRI